MLPKPQAIDISVTMLGKANLARRMRCWFVGFKLDAIIKQQAYHFKPARLAVNRVRPG
jgi:hypothetical protein